MKFYVEPENRKKDLGGLCECFIQSGQGEGIVAEAHIHQSFELLFCLEGSYKLVIERQTFFLNPGDVALIHPREPHQTFSLVSGKISYLVLKFRPEALYSANQTAYELKYIFPYLHFSGQRSYVYTSEELEGSEMKRLLELIFQERKQQNYGYEMALRSYITQVLLWFIRAWHEHRDTAELGEDELQKLQRALQYIENHLEENLDVDDAARYLGMGRSTFSRFFSKAAGQSFPAFVRGLRLSKAAGLLVNTEQSITEIAMECGFSTSSYMILCFRQQYNMTPIQFRKLYTRPPKDTSPNDRYLEKK